MFRILTKYHTYNNLFEQKHEGIFNSKQMTYSNQPSVTEHARIILD